jgi:hypothetical protein
MRRQLLARPDSRPSQENERRAKIVCKRVFVVTALAVSLAGGSLARQNGADDQKKSNVKIEPTKGGVRGTYAPGSLGVYGEVGGKPPSHDEPKGEKHVGVGIVFKFGGGGSKSGAGSGNNNGGGSKSGTASGNNYSGGSKSGTGSSRSGTGGSKSKTGGSKTGK